MKEAVIVSTARTPIGKAYAVALIIYPHLMAAHAGEAAVERAGIEADRVDDCIMGCAFVSGHIGYEYWPKHAALRAVCQSRYLA